MKHITKKPIKRKLYETKSWFFGKIDKPLLSLTPQKKGRFKLLESETKERPLLPFLQKQKGL